MLYFHLMEEGEEKERKKIITIGEEGFPRTRPALLAVSWVTAVRCN
jgi:hypothetical protein